MGEHKRAILLIEVLVEAQPRCRAGKQAGERRLTHSERVTPQVVTVQLDQVAAVRWGAMIESGTWQLCVACEYEFRSAKFARAFVFMLPICEEPTMAMLVGVCEECSKKDDGELLEIAYQGCRQIGLAKNKMDVGRA